MTDVAFSASAGDFRVAHVFSATWRVFSRHCLPIVGLYVLAFLPSDAAMLVSLLEPAGPGTGTPALDAGANFVSALLRLLAQSVLIYSVFQILLGRPADYSEFVRRGLRRSGAVILAALLVGLLVVLGFFLLVLPGLFLAVATFVATTACVVEEIGPIAGIRRSFSLTKNYRWKLLGLLLVFCILLVIAFAIIFAVGTAAFGPAAFFILGFIAQAAMNGLAVVLGVVIYRDLRAAKEGAAPERLAAVFD